MSRCATESVLEAEGNEAPQQPDAKRQALELLGDTQDI